MKLVSLKMKSLFDNSSLKRRRIGIFIGQLFGISLTCLIAVNRHFLSLRECLFILLSIRACSHKNTTHVFSANFDDYCVENICQATACLHIFALYPPLLCSKICTFILCEHAQIVRYEKYDKIYIDKRILQSGESF